MKIPAFTVNVSDVARRLQMTGWPDDAGEGTRESAMTLTVLRDVMARRCAVAQVDVGARLLKLFRASRDSVRASARGWRACTRRLRALQLNFISGSFQPALTENDAPLSPVETEWLAARTR